MLKLFILAVLLIAIAFAGIAIKMFFIKGAQFKKTCNSIDPNGNKIGCSCKSNALESCDNK
ncbi:MAG: hypothetical protein ACOYO1_07620 [Bacteroidales bacterium]